MALVRAAPFGVKDIVVPFVLFLTVFCGYSSQILFHYLPPGPLGRTEAIWFNLGILGMFTTFYRAVTTDPGPKGWVDKVRLKRGDEKDDELKMGNGMRWCKKCDAVKPPRAHHCKNCGRCIPKMDHHCPWINNCVSHTTFPHFLRFVLYCVVTMALLEYHLYNRIILIWEDRNLPYYLGPSKAAITHLVILVVIDSLSLLMLTILFVRATYALCTNTSQIESWEVERHESLVSRSRKQGGYVYTAGGQKMRVEKQEFPYDIGIWKNLCQGMGTANVLMWFLPFSGTPSVLTAGEWEENGFEDEGKMWPPLDPDKVGRPIRRQVPQDVTTYGSVEEEKDAFRRRQEKDLNKLRNYGVDEELEGLGDDRDMDEDSYEGEYEEGMDGEEGWTNSDGDRLRDYGVDEEAEELDEDDIPLGELIRRRNAKASGLE